MYEQNATASPARAGEELPLRVATGEVVATDEWKDYLMADKVKNENETPPNENDGGENENEDATTRTVGVVAFNDAGAILDAEGNALEGIAALLYLEQSFKVTYIAAGATVADAYIARVLDAATAGRTSFILSPASEGEFIEGLRIMAAAPDAAFIVETATMRTNETKDGGAREGKTIIEGSELDRAQTALTSAAKKREGLSLAFVLNADSHYLKVTKA